MQKYLLSIVPLEPVMHDSNPFCDICCCEIEEKHLPLGSAGLNNHFLWCWVQCYTGSLIQREPMLKRTTDVLRMASVSRNILNLGIVKFFYVYSFMMFVCWWRWSHRGTIYTRVSDLWLKSKYMYVVRDTPIVWRSKRFKPLVIHMHTQVKEILTFRIGIFVA